MFTFGKNLHSMKFQLKKYSYSLLFLSFFLFSFGARAQFNVTPIAKGAIHPEKEGFVYALPRNTVCVEIMVDRTETVKVLMLILLLNILAFNKCPRQILPDMPSVR